MADPAALELLTLAKYDAEVFEALSDRPHMASIVGFHAQQCVEKAIKAVCTLYKVNYPLTHNLAHLWDVCEAAKYPCPVAKRDLIKLMPYAVEGRYHTLIGGTTIEQISQTMHSTFAWAKQLIETTSN